MKPSILLFGMPRSGTTWIAKILDSHPAVDYRHEPDSLVPIDGVPLLPHLDDQAAREAFATYLAEVGDMRQLRVCGKQPVFAKQWAFGKAGATLLRANILSAKLASRAGMAMGVASTLLAGREQGVLLWKSIESVGRIGLAACLAPPSRCILLMRHPCGHVASVLQGQAWHLFSASTGPQHDEGMIRLMCESPQGQSQGLKVDAMMAMSSEEVLAWRWRIFNDHALSQVGECDNVLPLRYEAVCEDPPGQAERMICFAGLDWHRQCREFVEQSCSGDTSGYYSVVKNPMQSATKWKDSMSAESIDRVLSVVAGSAAARFYDI